MPHECTTCNRTFPDGSKEMLSGCPDCGGNKFRYRPDRPDEPRDGESPSPSGDAPDPPPAGAGPEGTGSPSERGDDGPVSRARTTVREWVGRGSEGEADASTAPADGATPDRTAPTDSDVIEAREEPLDQSVEGDTATPPVDDEAPDDEDTATPSADGEVPEDAPDTAVDAEIADGEDTAQASARSSVIDPDELPDRSVASTIPPSGDAGQGSGDDADDRPDLSELREELNDQFESIKIVEPGQYELNLMELYDRQEYIISLQEDGRYVIEVPESWRSGPE